MSKLKWLSTQKLILSIGVGTILSSLVIASVLLGKPDHSTQQVLAAEKTALPTTPKITESIPSYPARIVIPVINVDASLDYVVLGPNGILKAPKVPANAGWFAWGPVPGQMGSAVIDGHFGYENNIPAVFDNLHKLQTGDVLTVIDDLGVNINFVVRELRVFSNKDDTSSIFGLADSKARLNLITCQGAWDQEQKSYSGRLVVFTDKV